MRIFDGAVLGNKGMYEMSARGRNHMKPMDEDELTAYRQEANEEEYNREQQRKLSRNTSKHVLDPDREWPEGEEEE
jgi:hypothetical protein